MSQSLYFFQCIIFTLVALSVHIFGGTTTSSADGSPSDALLHLVQEFEKFKNLLDSIDARLKTLQTTVEQRISPDDSKCTIRDITEAIRNQRFNVAEEKIYSLSDQSKIATIIHDVFADSPANFESLLNFANSLKKSSVQLLILSALREEIRSSGNADPYKLIGLVEELEKELVREKDDKLKEKFQDVMNSAIDDVKTTATSILKTALISDKYKNVEVTSLASAIFKLRSDVSNEVMERVVDGVFGVVSAGRILDSISSHKDIPQVITGLNAIFNRFNFAGNLNNDATLKLAYEYRQLQERPEYSSLGKELRDDVEKVIQQLPVCAKNLFFSPEVCFWNKGMAQYLYAASSAISHDTERRSIYLWYPGDVKSGSFWKASKMGNDFFFKNIEHSDEYLYAADFEYNKDMRYVFTWIPGNNTDPQSAWSVELDGDYCYIRTSTYNEYLFAPGLKYDKLNSRVFTWKPGTSVRSAEFQWQITNCGQADVGRTNPHTG